VCIVFQFSFFSDLHAFEFRMMIVRYIWKMFIIVSLVTSLGESICI